MEANILSSHTHTHTKYKHKRITGNNKVGKTFLITMFGSGKIVQRKEQIYDKINLIQEIWKTRINFKRNQI